MTEKIHLVVATPCFGGQVSSIYAGSVFHLQRSVRSRSNIDLTVLMRDGDALITRARANLVTLFLDNPTATHLLFVDADIGFTPDQVFRLIESGADVVAGVYPIKRVNWDKARRMLGSNRPAAPSAALDYVLEIDDPDHVIAVNGFTRVRYAGTGFLMIRRHVLEKMCEHPAYASLQFFREHSHRRARRKSQPVRIVRMHDRPERPGLISARISRSASAGPISAAKSGPISRAVSTMSVRRCSTAISPCSLPQARHRQSRPMWLEIVPAARPHAPAADAASLSLRHIRSC